MSYNYDERISEIEAGIEKSKQLIDACSINENDCEPVKFFKGIGKFIGESANEAGKENLRDLRIMRRKMR